MKTAGLLLAVLLASAGLLKAQDQSSSSSTNKEAAKEAARIKLEAELAAKMAEFKKDYAAYIEVIKNEDSSTSSMSEAWKKITEKWDVRFPGITPKGLIWDKAAGKPKDCEIAMPGKDMSIDLGGGVKMDFVWCKRGTFKMGSTNGDDDEKPVHDVTISKGFWIGKYEVTQEQWGRMMQDNPSKEKSPKKPVDHIRWTYAQLFAKKLSGHAQSNVYSHITFELPTEAQWEYACRAGTSTAFSFGDDEGDLWQYGNYCDKSNTGRSLWQDKEHNDGHDKSAPAGSYKPNAWGIYDMHGNVYEWCADWYENYKAGSAADPAGPETGQRRVMRGGSWAYTATHTRSATRNKNFPVHGNYDTGFRIIAH